MASGVGGQISLWDRFPFGLDENREEVRIGLVERSMLVGGEPGSGKSSAIHMPLAVAANDPLTRVTVLDPKLVETAMYASSVEDMVGGDILRAIEVLGQLQLLMNDRYERLLSARLRKIDRSAGLPLHAIFVDELAFYTGVQDRKQREAFVESLRDIVARGRAAGVIVIAATQKPAADVVPSSLRDLFGFRLALRCTTKEASDTILGSGWASRGYDASTISPADRGVGFLLADDGIPKKLRTYYLDDATIDRLAARAEGLRAEI